jgi:hypothetical protein
VHRLGIDLHFNPETSAVKSDPATVGGPLNVPDKTTKPAVDFVDRGFHMAPGLI